MQRDTVIYVSKMNGKDHWSGSAKDPLGDGSDGPCASLHVGLLRARRLRRTGFSPGKITILLEEGDYFLYEPIRLFACDRDIHFVSHGETSARIHSAVSIQNWSISENHHQKCWIADLPVQLHHHLTHRSLFVNGKRRFRSLSDHDGWHQFESVPDLDPKSVLTGERLFQGSDVMIIPPGVIEGSEEEIQSAEIIVSHFWVLERLPIISYDSKTRKLVTSAQSLISLRNDHTGTFAKFRVENLKKYFLNPGEWYIDKKLGKIFYIPYPEETIDNVKIEIPLLTQLFLIEGTPEKSVTGIYFKGIEFYGTESLPPQNYMTWSQPYDMESKTRLRDSSKMFIESHNNTFQSGIAYGVSPQAAHELPGVMHLRYAENCVFDQCQFHGLGIYAIVMEEGCWQCEVSRCELYDLGAGGIQMDGAAPHRAREFQNGQHLIQHNHIYDTGMIYPSGVGILSMFSSQNRILENHLHHLSYSGISCGWMWGYDRSVSWGHSIEKNTIHDLGVRGGLSDMGGIYLLGVQHSTYVCENTIYDVSASTYGGAGIYLDEGSALLTVERNLIYGKCHYGFLFHKVRENRIRYNKVLVHCSLCAFSLVGLMSDESGILFPKNTLLIERNLVVIPSGKSIYQDVQFRVKNKKLSADLNWYGTWENESPLICEETLNAFSTDTHASNQEVKRWMFQDWQAERLDLCGGTIKNHGLKWEQGKVIGHEDFFQEMKMQAF